MLMVILGAGASYDSSSRFPASNLAQQWRPPLANQLFREDSYGSQMARHNGCAGFFPILRRANSIEERLEALSEEAKELPHIARQLLELRGYLKSVVQASTSNWFNQYTNGATNQVELLLELERWRYKYRKAEPICLVTFNYDTLLEHACNVNYGLFFTDILESYVSDPRCKLFKLHGSMDWSRAVTNVHGTVADSAPQLEWTDEYIKGENAAISSGKAYVPAIAVPTMTKSTFECPPHHRQVLQKLLPEVDRLLVIGWKGREKHFLNLWTSLSNKKLDRVQIVTGTPEGANEVVENLLNRAGITTSDLRTSTAGFSPFLTKNAGQELQAFLYD